MPKVSAILPLYNGIKYIDESIYSIQNQTFTDWEFIIINEFGSNDGSADVIKNYAANDCRIKFIQNEKRLGLAESLNIGICKATGEYIARVDVDDPSYSSRFKKQVNYLDSNPEVFLCGTLQRSVLPDKAYILEVPTDSEELKAALLFGCEISHCSVMFRKNVFIDNNLHYNPDKLGEDYDLWTRIMFQHKLVNLPEVLVDHRWGFDNISLNKGEALKQEVREISAKCLDNFGINILKDDLILLSGWRNKPEEYAKYNTEEFLHKQSKLLINLYNQNMIFRLIDASALKKILFKRWNWTCDCAGIFYQEIPYNSYYQEQITPKVTIVLPLYNAIDTLRETIDSILVQEFKDWELIIISEAGNTDGSTDIAYMYAFFDSRIKVILNSEKIGLSDSLNVGIKEATTDFIARIDADDLSNAKRIGTQYSYLTNNPDVGICQTYQHYFGGEMTDFIHKPPLKAEEMKAKLLFFCDACHSTIMFRKDIFQKYNLQYSNEAALEDYELWTRAVRITKFITIPEVYGEYRIGRSNISIDKMGAIESNMCQIIADQLRTNLDIHISEEYIYLLNGWNNIFNTVDMQTKNSMLDQLQHILYDVWQKNKEKEYYEDKALLQAIVAKWRWAKYNEPWQGYKYAVSIESALELPLEPRQAKILKLKNGIKNIMKLPIRAIQRLHLGISSKEIALIKGIIEEETKRLINVQETAKFDTMNYVESMTWERYQRTEKLLKEIKAQNEQLQNKLTQISYQQNLIPYYKGEAVRIVFLFQIASFWPSWESFYRACLEDDRFDVKFVFLDETATEDIQMNTARDFLDNNSIDYLNYDSFDLEQFRPHVMVIQTPYDNWHRQYAHWSINFKALGTRVMYIPYGIEISDTEDSHNLHFQTTVIDSCWRIYTFSERMRQDYLKYALNRNAVRALGLPRLDGLYNKQQFSLNPEIKAKCKGRKIVLWKLHFPKEISENGRSVTITPDIDEYISFAKLIHNYKDLFFIFMPHPRFKTQKISYDLKRKIQILFSNVGNNENIFVDERDDYRQSLANADYIIIDRSAVMVEAGAMDVPVLYMSNKEYYEPVTEAIRPLIESYCQGSSSSDMVRFIDMCQAGMDTHKYARKQAFEKCIPFFDGKSGLRIKEDIIRDLENNVL